MEKIILASGSPRRREILHAVGLDFEVAVSDADESSVKPGEDVGIYVQELAMLKASCTAKALRERGERDVLIVAADTVVMSEGKILGKPHDEADARAMLAALSGKTHEVLTGICVFRLRDAFSVCAAERTEVTFRMLSEELIGAYVATGEPLDKAGAYGIQGRGALLCEKINGDYFNVVGLPVSELCRILDEEFGYKTL